MILLKCLNLPVFQSLNGFDIYSKLKVLLIIFLKKHDWMCVGLFWLVLMCLYLVFVCVLVDISKFTICLNVILCTSFTLRNLSD